MRAHAIAIFQKKLLLLLSDNNPNQGSPNTWNLIGGHAEGNETPSQTLLREFKEETTIEPKHYQFLLELPEADTNLFYVLLTEEEAHTVRLGNEGAAIKFFSLEELKDLPIYQIVQNSYPHLLPFLHQFMQ